MAKTILLTELKILEMRINPDSENITVKYVIIDEFGEIYGREKVETYWVTLPANAGSADVQLPANFVSLVTTLYDAGLDALKGKYL